MMKALRFTAVTLTAAALAAAAMAAPQTASAPAASATPSAPAAPPPPACTGPEFHQLDFWVGEWDLTWPARGNTPAGTGTNRVEKILDGCVVQENFSTAGPPPFSGRSVSLYSVFEKKWKQTWVDNQGVYLDLTGEFKDGEMRLFRHGPGPDGKPRLARMIYTNIKPDSFDWRWEVSTDDGKTWNLNWGIHYKRKGSA
jgi:hypothetical protein